MVEDFKNKDFSVDNSEFSFETEKSVKKVKEPKKKQKKKGCSIWVWLLAIVGISIAIAIGVIVVSFDYLGLRPNASGEIVVNISQGMSGKQIASELKKEGAINNDFVFRIYSKLKNYESNYKYGVYTFGSNDSYDEIADKLQNDGAKAESITVTIPEQSSIDDMAEILERNGVCTASDFKSVIQKGNFDYDFIKDIPSQSVYYRFEGYLFPDTYDFYCYDSEECARLAVDKMLSATNKKFFTVENIDAAKKLGYSMHEVLTMASIVELEASGSPSEMANVAAVFYNRLVWNDAKLLGSSPTMEYPYGNGRYDTNKTEGLPPGPLCAPSLNALNASLNPTKDFGYTYFVTDKNMKFYYRSSLNEHYAIIRELKNKGLWAG